MSAARIVRILAYGLLIASAALVAEANDVAVPTLAKISFAIGAATLVTVETDTEGSG